MIRLTDVVALSISIASMVSSVLYTYDSRHVNSARFFNEIHTEYASTEMMEAFDALETFRDAVDTEYASEYVRLKQVARTSYLNQKAKEKLDSCENKNDALDGDVPSHCKAQETGSTKSSQPNLFRHMFGLANEEDLEVDIKLGKRLDESRRRILHYFGKIMMFYDLGYLQLDHLKVFPGRARCQRAMSLVEPLVKQTGKIYKGEVHTEHYRIISGIRTMFDIEPAKSDQAGPA